MGRLAKRSVEATLMFFSAAAGSTPVPLKRIMFSWGGSAFWDGAAGSWTTGSLANYTVPGTSAGTTDYPVWSKHNDNTYVLE